jgi:hypothetical protein
MTTPKWTVLYNIVSKEVDDSPDWIGTGWEFFNDEAAADRCYTWHDAAGNVPTKRPFHPNDAVHLAATHRNVEVLKRAYDTLLDTAARYDHALGEQGYDAIKFEDAGQHKQAHLQHCRWMCQQIPLFVVDGRIDKANRWIGYVQGIFLSYNFFTLEEMKDHNRTEAPC